MEGEFRARDPCQARGIPEGRLTRAAVRDGSLAKRGGAGADRQQQKGRATFIGVRRLLAEQAPGDRDEEDDDREATAASPRQ